MHRFKGKLPAHAPRTAGLAALVTALVAVVAVSSAGAKTAQTSAGTVVFMSTQLTPVTEQQKFINVTLKGFSGSVVDGLVKAGHPLMEAYALFFVGAGAIGIPAIVLCLVLAAILRRRRLA